MKKQWYFPMILLAFFLLNLTLNAFSDTSPHPLDYKQDMITLEGDSGSVTLEKAEKKLPMEPKLTAAHTATIIFGLLLLVYCEALFQQLRRCLFIGPVFYQANYVNHFY